jgi:hypothetical protein
MLDVQAQAQGVYKRVSSEVPYGWGRTGFVKELPLRHQRDHCYHCSVHGSLILKQRKKKE